MSRPALLTCLAVLAFAVPAGPAVPQQAATAAGYSELVPVDLRVDGVTTPLGIDNDRPSLSWRLAGRAPDAHQSAYRVLVATSPDRLVPGRQDVWDSGQVRSAESVGIRYDGAALAGSTRYFWKVQVWDDNGVPASSAASWWETALLGPDGWAGAEFVGPDTGDELSWRDFTLEADFRIEDAAASFLFRVRDPANFYLWQINTAARPGAVLLRPHVRVDGRFSNLGEIDLAPVLTPDNAGQTHHLKVSVTGDRFTTWIDGVQVDSRQDGALAGPGTLGFRSSSTGGRAERARYDNLVVRGPDGATLFTDDFSATPDPYFPSTPIADGQLAPTAELTILAREPEAPMMRSEFRLDKEIASARAYVYGLGLYELRLNGAKAGDQVLTPANGQYRTHLLYDTYDVTAALRTGDNAVGLWLAEGYGQDYSQYAFRYLDGKRGALVLRVTYHDGSTDVVTTSAADWTWSRGPIVSSDLYGGETYDARSAPAGWDRPGFDDSDWRPVRSLAAPDAELVANPAPPRRVVRTLPPVAVTEPRPGVFVFDLGENIAGWSRLRVRGPAGATVRMATAEELRPDGLLDTRTNRNAAATDTYVLRGGGAETYEPRFTYHGFRYVQVTGYPGTPTADHLQGRVVHADLEPTASFRSSDELLNAIWRNNRRAIANNSMSTPTDTPVRDERTPPAMDVQAYSDAATREFRTDRFYAKYLDDLPPGVALPTDDVKAQYPDMAGGQVSLAWTLYEQYGDLAPLRTHYPAMKAFVDRNVADHPDLIWPADQGFGDWCPPVHGEQAAGGMGGPDVGDCFSEISLVNTALWYQQARDVARSAEALGEPSDAAHFTGIAERVKDAFNQRFLNAAGDTYGSGRMTTSVLPLALGMVPPAARAAVGERLVRTIREDNDGHLDTGIFGTRYLVDALAAAGRIDVAMTMLAKTTYPGFGFQLSKGATTPWEQWTYDAAMITHDHAMFAGINASLYTRLGGITPDSPGYATMTISPEVPAGLRQVRADLDTVRGRVSSAWTRSPSQYRLVVTVPANTTARVEVPTFGRTTAAVRHPRLARPVGVRAGRAVFEVGSGTYAFTVRA